MRSGSVRRGDAQRHCTPPVQRCGLPADAGRAAGTGAQFVDRGLNNFSSTVAFQLAGQRIALTAALPSTNNVFVSLPLAPGAAAATADITGAARGSSAVATMSASRTGSAATATGSARGLLQAASTYAQASALALFTPQDKSNAPATPPASPPASGFMGTL